MGKDVVTTVDATQRKAKCLDEANHVFKAIAEFIRARYDQGNRGNAEQCWTIAFSVGGLMKAYSLDLREKIIDAHIMEGVSVRKVAKRFRVATSFVETLLRRLRETGDILPKPHGGGPQSKLKAEQIALVAALVEADNDATLAELCDPLAAATSIRVSRSTMGRVVNALGFTRKKKRCTPPRRRVPGFNKPELSIGKGFETLPRRI